MIALKHFNALNAADATALLAPCVAIPTWGPALVRQRPFADRAALLRAAQAAMQMWGEAELNAALGAHPRIGERPGGRQVHAALSRKEQAAVDHQDDALAQALREANARYEARFGRIFLIRAKGLSGEAILQALMRRLQHEEGEERLAALDQLREITLLRLEGVIGE
ncbi:2-oxo-4-hydroxy-4-carboxy-5-ureidoimidazoline decarboxylase [Serratia marcescens]|uniref:2-oxo-4-hydroxy-4-carboxy-5-ureidoimidazoline decarboxylase n=1 Tax=Serratia marcescens TaxID=615 RepID=UPI0011E7639D|nr:2-oxo-4-hydroxy-4-carboxy-5-ureidoimidazoline decarboxylase [Serratia marcescens]